MQGNCSQKVKIAIAGWAKMGLLHMQIPLDESLQKCVMRNNKLICTGKSRRKEKGDLTNNLLTSIDIWERPQLQALQMRSSPWICSWWVKGHTCPCRLGYWEMQLPLDGTWGVGWQGVLQVTERSCVWGYSLWSQPLISTASRVGEEFSRWLKKLSGLLPGEPATRVTQGGESEWCHLCRGESSPSERSVSLRVWCGVACLGWGKLGTRESQNQQVKLH